MRSQPKERISKKALSIWRLKATLGTLIVLMIPIVYRAFFANHFAVWTWVFWVLLSGSIMYGIVSIVILPSVRWHRWRYQVLEQEIDLQYGVLIVKRTLIPMNRVQHVDTEQGPLLRRYDLAAVTISTAATIHEIPALTTEVADQLRDRISTLATEAEDDDE